MKDRPTPHTHLQRKHAVLLVAGVLLLHLGLLSDASLHWTAVRTEPAPLQALVTRQIVLPPPVPKKPPIRRKPAQPKPTAHAPAPADTATTDSQTSTSATAAVPFDDFGATAQDRTVTEPTYDLPPTNADGLTAATAFKAPESVNLNYDVQGKVKGFNYSASGELQWRQDGQNYEARLEVSALFLGSRVQTSNGTLGDEGLMPTRFGDKTKSERAAHFQRDKGIISFSANKPEAKLLKGAQDRLSVVLQIGALLAADPQRFPAESLLSFQTASQNEAEIWLFEVGNAETLRLPYGELSAVKLSRAPRRDFDQRIEIWYAPSLGYLPVRLRITNANGDTVDQLLNSIQKPPP
jgi:Protein of unknown function (DUF3108)